MPLIPLEHRDRLEVAYAHVQDPKDRWDAIQTHASFDLVVSCFGTAWASRIGRERTISTANLLSERGKVVASEEATNPISALLNGGNARDALHLHNFATFLAEVLSSRNMAAFQSRLDQLRHLTFWAAFHEVRAPAYFTRMGCRIDYPVQSSLDKVAKPRKSVDLTVEFP